MLILALEVGTSAVKAAVLDGATGQLVSPVARTAYELDRPTPDAAEVPAERLWNVVTATPDTSLCWKGALEQAQRVIIKEAHPGIQWVISG